jgi:hypothetical protein
MIEFKKGSDAELGYRTSTMTWDEAAKVLADRPDLLAILRRIRFGHREQQHLTPKSKPRAKDVREMTVQELGILAKEVRSAPAGNRKVRRTTNRMSIAAWHLKGSGALQQMLWWCRGIEPEAPPNGTADVVQMPPR